MPDTALMTALGERAIAEASSSRVQAYFAEHKEPPEDVAQRLRQLRRSVLEECGADVVKLYAALPTNIAAWLGDDSLDAETRTHIQGILARNREAFAALAEM